MNTAEKLLQYQATHMFEDTVLEFMHKVVKETGNIWEFEDKSQVCLHNEVFCDIIDLHDT